MPNGKTHDRITFITAPIVMVSSLIILGGVVDTIIITSTFFFASMMFNGDLDTNSRPYNRWWLFKVVWVPYQMLFTHRSIFTHGIVIGTIVRLIYLSPLFILISKIFHLNLQEINWHYLLLIFIGLELGNSIHTISDKLFR